MDEPVAERADGHAKGRGRILQAARNLLIGGATKRLITMREVAREAGLTLGAVQHFYPTKSLLVRAAVDSVVEELRSKLNRIGRDPRRTPRERLDAVIDLLVADGWRPQSRRVYFALHVVGASDARVGQLVDDLYAEYREQMAGFLGAAYPHLLSARASEIALQLCAMLEGLMVYTSPTSRAIHPRGSLAALVKLTVAVLAEADASTESPP